MNKYGCIYKITNKINNKIYIGKTILKDPKYRFNVHVYLSKNKPKMLICRAIAKYGKQNFTFEIIHYASQNENLNFLEESYIKAFNSLTPNGYNIQEISNGVIYHSDKTKAKMKSIKQQDSHKQASSIAGKQSRGKKFKNSSSKYIGVFRYKETWKSYATERKKNINLGTFNTEKDAAIARDLYEYKTRGKNANLNFPELIENYHNGSISVISNKPNSKIPKNKKSNSDIIGVSYSPARNRWIFERKGYKFKSFKTKEEAEQHAYQQYNGIA